ncbi:N,N-dimethylformamidase beta subunit family domain-containing protein [Terrabacter sp. AAH1]
MLAPPAAALRPDVLERHSAFVTVGHDEYWTKAQRGNVEPARDGGVNLAFQRQRDLLAAPPGGERR